MKNEYYNSQILADNLREYLAYHQMTMSTLAQKVGVSRPTVSDWCSGKKLPRMDKVEKICEIFHITKADLLGYEFATVVPDNISEIQVIYDDLNNVNKHKLLAYAYQLQQEENLQYQKDHPEKFLINPQIPPDNIKKEDASAATDTSSDT